ncbi:MAG: hypothetical protein MUF54_25225 [Polyangiaceae bacterium]|nr:hypothetical protein [Polyangiaceae bacterium]
MAQLSVLLAAELLAACTEAPLPARAAPAAPPPLDLDPIEKLLPAAELRWVLTIDPQSWLRHPALTPGLSRLLTDARIAALEHSTAIDVSRLSRAVIAAYPRSTVYLLQGVSSPNLAVERFEKRMLTGVTRKVYRPDLIRLQGHGYNGRRRAIVSLGGQVVAIESGSALHTGVAALYALGRLSRAPRALAMLDIALLAQRFGDTPLFAVAIGPFQGTWAGAVHGVLRLCTAVGGCVRADDAGVLSASLLFVGEWGADAERALQRVSTSWEDLQHSSFGRLTGLDQLVAPMKTTQEAQLVGVHVRVSGPRLLDGLYTAVRAELREMFDFPDATPAR